MAANRNQIDPNIEASLVPRFSRWRHKGNGQVYLVQKVLWLEVFSHVDYDYGLAGIVDKEEVYNWVAGVKYRPVDDEDTEYVRTLTRFLDRFERVS